MNEKPSYLGLLNAIAVGEARGDALLSTWAVHTADTELAAALRMVALREREHAAAFAKRICELGYDVIERDDPDFAERLACARGDVPDTERFRRLLGYDGAADPSAGLARLFDDVTIDPQTGALLGRFIAEERDSERVLRAHHARIVKATAAPQTGACLLSEDGLGARLDRLETQIGQLRDFLAHRDAG